MALVTDIDIGDEIHLDGGRVTVRVIQSRSRGKIRVGIQASKEVIIDIKRRKPQQLLEGALPAKIAAQGVL